MNVFDIYIAYVYTAVICRGQRNSHRQIICGGRNAADRVYEQIIVVNYLQAI